MAAGMVPVEVPGFREQTDAWKQHAEEQAELDALAKEAHQRDEQMTADVRELQQRYDEQVEAAVKGEGEPPHGPRPERDAAVAVVAQQAFQRAAQHRRDAARITAAVADEVVEAAGAWWEEQAPAAQAAIGQALAYVAALNDALTQVRAVRRAKDGEDARNSGVRPHEGLAARSAENVSLDVLAAVIEKHRDPFELRAPEAVPGAIQRTGPGMRRWSEPPPASKDHSDAAPAAVDPVRAFL